MEAGVRAKKVDTTHGQIRDHLRKAGWAVRSTAVVGDDFPDLVVARHAFTALVECKSPGAKLSSGQQEFKRKWPGVVVMARTGLEAEAALQQAIANQLLASWRVEAD